MSDYKAAWNELVDTIHSDCEELQKDPLSKTDTAIATRRQVLESLAFQILRLYKKYSLEG